MIVMLAVFYFANDSYAGIDNNFAAVHFILENGCAGVDKNFDVVNSSYAGVVDSVLV